MNLVMGLLVFITLLATIHTKGSKSKVELIKKIKADLIDIRPKNVKVFETADVNSDGKLSLAEHMSLFFEKCPMSFKIQLSLGDNEATVGNIEKCYENFGIPHFYSCLQVAPLDKNGDGKVTQHELVKHHFKQDSNKDGYITKEEIIMYFHKELKMLLRKSKCSDSI